MLRLLAGFFVAITTVTAHAGLVQISQPDAAYRNETTKIAITQANGTDLNSITDGTLVVSFSHTREVHTVPSGGWSTWSSAPFSESSTPRVLAANGYNDALTSLTMTLDEAVTIFGFELEGDPQSLNSFTAAFYNGANLVGSITRDVHGNAGARLFAAEATGADVFTSVVITGTVDFAIAQLRYALPAAAIPEPTGAAMLLIGASVLLRRRG